MWIRAKITKSQEMSLSKPTPAPQFSLPRYLSDFKEVFEKKAAERFPKSRPWDHVIDLKSDFIPKDCKVYPLSPLEQNKLDEFLEENLSKGYIRPSKSPISSPFFFVSNKDVGLRPCQYYRYLND